MPHIHESEPIRMSPQHIDPKPEVGSSATDWFETVPGTHDRLYAPGLRTELSQRVWDEVPAFLQENSETLQRFVGSDELSVFMHGSAALGVAGEGGEKIKNEFKLHPADKEYWHTKPSDIDLLVVTGQQEEGIDNEWVGFDFAKVSNFEERLGLRADITVINLPEMLKHIKAFDSALDNKEWPKGAYEILVEAGLILASPSMHETNEGNTASIHNKLLKTILELSHGELVWGTLRRLFHELTVDYEDGAWYPHPHQASSKRRRNVRVNTAFEQVLTQRDIPPEKIEKAKKFMRARRAAIDLPDYEQIAALREQILSSE